MIGGACTPAGDALGAFVSLAASAEGGPIVGITSASRDVRGSANHWRNDFKAAKAGDAVMTNLNENNARKVRAELRELSPLLDSVIGWRVYRYVRSPDALMTASQSWIAGSATDFLATAAGALDLLIIPFFVYYILVDFQRWRISFDELIPARFGDAFSRLFDEVGRILQSYVLGQLLIAMIMAVLYAIGFAFLGVPAWAGLAALSGFLNVVPYVGTGLGLILASGFTFTYPALDRALAAICGTPAGKPASRPPAPLPALLPGRRERLLS